MIEVLRKIWRFAGEEQGNIRKSMVRQRFVFPPIKSILVGMTITFLNN